VIWLLPTIAPAIRRASPRPFLATVLTGDPLNALLAVDNQRARLTLDVDVLGKPCIRLILDADAALDLALCITGTVMRQRPAATA
jgi:hypothetical protein